MFIGVTVTFRWCYGIVDNVTAVLQRRHGNVTAVLRRCYWDVTSRAA